MHLQGIGALEWLYILDLHPVRYSREWSDNLFQEGEVVVWAAFDAPTFAFFDRKIRLSSKVLNSDRMMGIDVRTYIFGSGALGFRNHMSLHEETDHTVGNHECDH